MSRAAVWVLKVAIIAVLLLGAGVASAQHKLQAKPSEKLLLMKLEDGTVLAVDGVSRRFYRADPLGTTFELSFEEVAAHAEPDPVKRAALISKLEADLANPVNAGYLETGLPLGAPGAPEPSHPVDNCNPVCEVQSNAGSVSDGGITDLDAVPVIGKRPVRVTGGVFWTGGYLGAYDGGRAGGGVAYQQYWADDYERFKRERQAACSAATADSLSFGAILALNVLTCGAAVAGVPAGGAGPALLGAACFAESILTVRAWVDMRESDAKCAATYHGPGTW